MHVDQKRARADDRQATGGAPAGHPGHLASAVAADESERGRTGDKARGRGSGGLNGWQNRRSDALDRADLSQNRQAVYDLLGVKGVEIERSASAE